MTITIQATPPFFTQEMDSLCNLYVHRENAAWAGKKKQLPVTLVTGFLGAGKTTLLNHVLSNKHNLRIAAAVNDFAAINIDSQIVKSNRDHDSVVELTNGCLCCSISGEFQTAVWNLLQDADIGKIDYLMIETSGVTDPLATIATLEQDYGRMYRIRLDAVVTVVDTDALVAKLEGGDLLILESSAADSQLKCADVVLLNKKDLVTESQLVKAKEYISSYVPGCQIYACERCAVPLNYLMEVREVAAGSTVVSHEVASAAYTINQMPGDMSEERQRRVKESLKEAKEVGHILKDEFNSIVFESKAPFRLAAFQAVLGKSFPKGVSRMKGTLWFAEDRSHLYSFHMSGRQRYEITLQASVRESLVGSFSIQLVAIGRGIDGEFVKKLLNDCVAERDTNTKYIIDTGPLYSASKTIIANDARFEIVEQSNFDPQSGQLLPTQTNYVDFRVTGVIEYGVSVEEASKVYGIDFNRMNRELAKRVNGSSRPVCLLPVQLPTGVEVCRHALSGDTPFLPLFGVVSEVSDRLIVEFFRAVGYCKCGM